MHSAEQNIKKSHTLEHRGTRFYHSSNASNFPFYLSFPFFFFFWWQAAKPGPDMTHGLFQPLTPYNPLLSSNLLSSGRMNSSWGTYDAPFLPFVLKVKRTWLSIKVLKPIPAHVSPTYVHTSALWIYAYTCMCFYRRAQEWKASEDVCFSIITQIIT